jgi:anti-sigma B factor antagonist
MNDTSDATISALPTDEGEALLLLAGELDLSCVEHLWLAAVDALEGHPTRLVVDVSAVTFLNSTTLGTFVRIQRRADELGTSFALRHPTPLVQRLLRLSGLDSQLAVEP